MSYINIKVSFYNEEEREKFQLNYPSEYEVIDNAIVSSCGELTIPLVDFKTFFLFRHQSENDDRDSFNSFFRQLDSHWGQYALYFEDDGTTGKFVTKGIGNSGNPHISESLGVGGALAVVSKLFLDLTQADWKRIPTHNKHKDFDFNLRASTGDKILLIEAKGAMVEDNRYATSVSDHKLSIHSKKEDLKFIEKYPQGKFVRIGCITSADPLHNVHVRLVDPPPPELDVDPKYERLMARLWFYYNTMQFVARRSHLTLLLANRIRILESLKNYAELDRSPLLNSYQDQLNLTKAFIDTHSIEKNRDIIGKAFIYHGQTFFVSLPLELVELLILQDFSAIRNYNYSNPSIERTELTARLRKENKAVVELFTEDVKNTLINNERLLDKDTHYTVRMNGDLHSSSSGLGFARLTRDELINNQD